MMILFTWFFLYKQVNFPFLILKIVRTTNYSLSFKMSSQIDFSFPSSSTTITTNTTTNTNTNTNTTFISANSTTALKANNPHRKHAHRRSAAISHEFSLDLPQLNLPQLNARSSKGSLVSGSPYSLQSPTLTFASSSSSLESQSHSHKTLKNEAFKKVQFVEPKHKKVKSWAGLFSRRVDIPEDSDFYSSSYVSTDLPNNMLHLSLEPETPLIDLDLALCPFDKPFDRPFDRLDHLDRRKISLDSDTILEEEEDTSIGQQQAASLSTSSLISTSSSINRARLARNCNSLQLGPLPLPRDQRDPKVLHRLSSTTNETITEPRESREPPQELPQESPQELIYEPTETPDSLRNSPRKVRRFSISSLSSFATTDSRKSTSSRVWNWMRKRAGP